MPNSSNSALNAPCKISNEQTPHRAVLINARSRAGPSAWRNTDNITRRSGSLTINILPVQEHGVRLLASVIAAEEHKKKLAGHATYMVQWRALIGNEVIGGRAACIAARILLARAELADAVAHDRIEQRTVANRKVAIAVMQQDHDNLVAQLPEVKTPADP